MRTVWIALVVLALLAAGSAAGAGGVAPWTHVRTHGPIAQALLAGATGRSEIVRGLLDSLERTDVVAYLSCTMTGSGRDPAGRLRFISSAAGIRYVLIEIDVWRASPWSLAALLGHELQHALEVAAAPGVRDDASLSAVYRQIGWESEHNRFETAAARDTGRRILNELAGFALKRASPSE